MELKQSKLINSLRRQPLIVLIRLKHDFFNSSKNREDLLLKFDQLSKLGIRNIEIGWDSNPEWINLISEVKSRFNYINIGVASISTRESLDSILSLDLNYSMSPLFKKELHIKAIKHNQLFIPGISNVESFKEAINLGYKILKIFPASKLGTKFLKELQSYKQKDIFFIGAGGIKTKNIKDLLSCGYNALVIGRELKDHLTNEDLKIWLRDH